MLIINNTNVTCKVVLSIATVMFVGIICYHVCLCIENYKMVKKLQNSISYRKQISLAHSQQKTEALLFDHEDEGIRHFFPTHEITRIAT